MSGTTLEQKTLGDGQDIGAAFNDFLSAFEAFKETNDERLGQLERRSTSDVVTDEKLTRIDKALDDHKRVVDDLVRSSHHVATRCRISTMNRSFHREVQRPLVEDLVRIKHGRPLLTQDELLDVRSAHL